VRALARSFVVRSRRIEAISDLSFSVWPGEFVSLVGPSGCGKSTLVRLLAGLSRPTAGTVRVGGNLVSGPPPDLLVLFQQYEKSLLPWRTVEKNVDFGLANQRLGRAERQDRVQEALEAVGLADARKHYPYQLSGGMQQRVALARALARRPRILLMDEPFSSLDALTRADLQDLTLRLWREHDQTILFVTHDVDEAVYLATRILVLSPRPARIRDDIEVGLEGHRDQATTRESAEFLHLRRHVFGLIRNQSGAPEVRDDALASA
jgi:NitT/TauT family transport system ATP-binding protein